MALAYQKNIDPDTSFALWKIEEQADELIAQLQLRDHERGYLDTLINGKRNLHWLSTRVLLRTMLNTSSYIDCQVDEHGKPYLANFPHFISLSHSFDYAAVMISKNKPVGIDIELIKDKIERIAHKFMNEDELSFIDAQHRTEHLYISWCAKEAIYKLQGKKNVSFLDNIRLSAFNYRPSGSFKASLELEHSSQDFEVHFERMDGYMIGYVADDNYAK
ncbi:MAG TPA: 4'-phosphopantetheinyl transferase superfamily protein [Daejeonella sp.]|nr:4'-phosphopantetheinyl transferase superfamily protein [Daejeonella sp.]